MLKVRIIPCLDVKDGRVVKGVQFVGLRDAGDPVEQARIYDAAGADELTFLDITASHENRDTILDVVGRTAEHQHGQTHHVDRAGVGVHRVGVQQRRVQSESGVVNQHVDGAGLVLQTLGHVWTVEPSHFSERERLLVGGWRLAPARVDLDNLVAVVGPLPMQGMDEPLLLVALDVDGCGRPGQPVVAVVDRQAQHPLHR